MKLQLTEQDMQQLHAFPAHRKAHLVNTIMARRPTRELTCTSNTQYDIAILKLRKSGYVLIDLQPMETAFTSLWYRRKSKLLGLSAAESVVMLVWEMGDDDSDVSALMRTWEL